MNQLNPAAAAYPGATPPILIVDDVVANIEQLGSALTGLAPVLFATSGPAALALAELHVPDVILLDIEMPGMDGYAVCRALQASPRTARCAIIFVTSHAAARHELLALNEGAIDFLQKPFDFAVARARVRNQLALQARTRELRAVRRDLTELLHALPAFVAYWDADFINRYSNDRDGRWFGLTPDGMRGQSLERVVGADNGARLRALALSTGTAGDAQLEVRIGAEGVAPLYCQAALVRRDRAGEGAGWLLLLTDVSAARMAQMALDEEREKFRITLTSIGDAVIATDCQGVVTFINPVAEIMTGYCASEALGAPVETVMPLCIGASGQASVNPVRVALRENRIVGMAFDSQLIRRDGRRYAVEDSAAPILDASGVQSGAIIVFHDVSEARAMAFKMTHLAQHDALTDLPNRVLLRDRTSQALEHASRSGMRVALLLLDLDNFKAINSAIGHAIGDALLKQLAERLRGALRVSDTISRQGGDEFIILMPALDAVSHADHVARALLALVAVPLWHEGARYDLTASIGLSLYPDDCVEQDAMYRHADAAMYKAKQEGKNRHRFFAADIEEKLLARNSLDRNLRIALDERQFTIAYQPKVDARNRRILGLEALIRWHRSVGMLVSPAEFIPLAEETGMIVQIGAFVLEQVCGALAELVNAGCATRIGVNISGKEFQEEGFADRVEAAIALAGVPAALLELEITEGTLMQDIVRSRANLLRLKQIGVSISIDDFGTGYSSLAYLKNFPIDVLKIDQSFVRDMLGNRSDASIICAIIHLANSLGMTLLAEGVEQQAQADALVQMGCTNMQGYLYARALPLAQLRVMLAAGSLDA
ncbi:two-component system response regulator [Massilia sp. S19_KUP03_FR1]|uniref:two-component system response regulator n=1 Tax=Massilia sp. S19_KUP03_FR1 TaxID=3025503 RepID=UPI002FCDD047